MFLAWLAGNYKAVGMFALIAGVAGYIWFLRADVRKHEAEAVALKADVATLKENLRKTEGAVKAMDDGMKNFQSFVNAALDSVQLTQRRIAAQNKVFQATLDNLAVLAAAARRIIDAPTIPFFMDNAVRSELVGIDNGVYHFRVLPPGSR